MAETFFFSAEPDMIDRPRVHWWLSEQSYWAQGRTRQAQDAAIDASRNYGVYDSQSEEQVAYGRVVTDGVTFAWLCDVFVATEVRGRGIGKMLASGIMEDLGSLNLKRVLLSTVDAHGLYSQFGFTALADPSKMMTNVR
ncbi:GNAT superfamily N-acetyltransferase [Arthrobacter sp. CAN_A212]|uniref:GNAT family N-acetyltransferase n=1 Tax=Arthrobacter sp. CAN_A212 TaxID=2787719 RepID=UPI0018CB2400